MRNSVLVQVGILLAIFLSLAGLGLSAILLQHHVVMEVGGDPILGGVCEAGKLVDCDAVLSSKWSTFAGQPTALWGYGFFSVMCAWYIIVGRPAGSRRWLHSLVMIGTGMATLGVIGLAFIMYVRIGEICPFCSATHVVTVLLFILTILLRPRIETSGIRQPLAPDPISDVRTTHPSIRLLAAFVLLAVMTTAAGWAGFHFLREKAYAEEYRKRWASYEADLSAVYLRFMEQPRIDFSLTADDPIRGDIHAPHTLIVYSDFLCPWCKTLADVLDKKLQEHAGRIRIVFRHFPMDTMCNAGISQNLHPGACAAAVTAEAARLLGGPEAFWKTHDALFADQKGFRAGPQKFVRDLAVKLGIDSETLWKKATGSTSTWNRIKEDVKKATELGTKSTPVVYLDGRKFDRYADEHFWKYLFWLDDQVKRSPGFRGTIPTTRPASTTPAATWPSSEPASQPVIPAASDPS